MTIRTLAAALLLTLSGCAAVPDGEPLPTADEAGIRLIDLTDEFAAVWEQSRAFDDAARVAAVRSHFEPLFPGFYSRERAGPFAYGDLILKALNEFPQKRAGIEEVSRRFRAMLGPTRESFEAEFGALGELPPIYLVHSLGEMDGGVRNRDGKQTMIFGADVIAENHLGHGIAPFFHHELFHAFHGRTFQGCGAVWCALWSEGLAVYVASRLNPGATDSQLLLTRPVPLRAAVDARRPEALCKVLQRLDSTETGNLVFGGGADFEGLPPRAGYYIGYLVAEEAGKTRSLQELAAMPAEQVRPVVEQALRKLADCPA